MWLYMSPLITFPPLSHTFIYELYVSTHPLMSWYNESISIHPSIDGKTSEKCIPFSPPVVFSFHSFPNQLYQDMRGCVDEIYMGSYTIVCVGIGWHTLSCLGTIDLGKNGKRKLRWRERKSIPFSGSIDGCMYFIFVPRHERVCRVEMTARLRYYPHVRV